jgi:hypothetical protein
LRQAKAGHISIYITEGATQEQEAVISMAAERKVSSKAEALNEFGDQLLRQLRGGSGGGGSGGGGSWGRWLRRYRIYESSSDNGEIPIAVVIVFLVLGNGK